MSDRCTISVGPKYLKIRFWIDDTDDFWHALYDFKDSLPQYARVFDSNTKIWTADKSYLDDITTWAKEWFDTNVFITYESEQEQKRSERENKTRYQEPNSDDPWAILWLLPGAPPEVIDASYRALAKLNHPDLGGNTEVMKSINLAYEKVKKK